MLEQLVVGTYAVDTETTGLRAFHGDRLFSLIVANADESWYFNFQPYPDLTEEWVLPREETFALLRPFFENPANVFYLHNAKFDLVMLSKENVALAGKIYDTEVNGRLLYNRHLVYNLGHLAKEIGLEKSEEVDEYIAAHKLFTWVKSPGKDKRAKWPHYDKVPHAIISRYGEKDGAITFKLGEHQRAELAKWNVTIPDGRLDKLIETEARLVKTCFRMEQAGIKIDKDYCQKAYDFETARAQKLAAEFTALSGMEFLDSRLVLAKAFTAAGEKYPTTEKGNPSFTDEVLEGMTTPLASLLRQHRTATKRANTYFANYVYFADENDRIHPNMRQAGTDTGRFSFSDPNLQNVPTEDTGDFPVRRAFIPCGPEWILVAIDYEQMEYRLLLDYAGEREVIRQILEDGLDVHQATANAMQVERQSAKTLNFMLLYGGGAQKLADAIGVTLAEAERMKEKYFEALPLVRQFSKGVADRANTRGYVFNWAGRICHFPWGMNPRTGKQDRFAYKAPNHVIQGGCADVVKIAMNGCDDYLQGKRSRMLLQVHDELLFGVHRSELDIVPHLRKIMESAYPARYLPLTCSVEWSDKSWGEGEPWGPEALAKAILA